MHYLFTTVSVLLTSFILSAFASPDIPLGPECLSEPMSSTSFRKDDIRFESHGAVLNGHLYLPQKEGRYPAMVMMHGGGSNVENLRSAPTFFAELLVRCGFAVVTYDKHGTGESGGDYASSTFDTFVADAGYAGKFLSRHAEVDDSRIGILGFSQGGRLAPVVATRYPHFSFVASVSGPIASVKETRMYALESGFREAGVSESIIQEAMPFWSRHFDAITHRDQELLQKISEEARTTTDLNHALLPPSARQLQMNGILNSMGRDYTEELSALSVPWYSLYGEADIIVPVETSIANIERIRSTSGNSDIEIKTIPGVGHSFVSADRSRSHRFELDVLAWLFETADVDIHPTGVHTANR